MFEQLNSLLFSLVNAAPGLAGWRLTGAVFAAEWVIMLVPAGLVMLWIRGTAREREAAVRALLTAVCALTVSMLIGMMWPHPRPFVTGVGHTFMHHAADSSFPSDHATSMFSVALALVFSRTRRAHQFGAFLLPMSVLMAWSRVYLGVHWPLDMVGAFLVSAAMAVLVGRPAGVHACAALVARMETIYRRVLAAPIARGWLRP
jgi:undecaprenyl-diphosphatase